MKYYFFPLVGLVLLGCLIYIFLQPRTASEQPPEDPLMERASSGDIEAIKAMRLRTEKERQGPLPNYWLYKGALAGDAKLIQEYEVQFRGLRDDLKKAEIASIRTSAAPADQKKVLLKRLSVIYPGGFKEDSIAEELEGR